MWCEVKSVVPEFILALTLGMRKLILPCKIFSIFLKILKFERLFQEFLLNYFNAYHMVNLNIVTKFQNVDIYEHFAKFVTCRLLTHAAW